MPSNFAAQLPAADSELAEQLAKDPDVVDFLGLSARVAERTLKQGLMDRLVETLREPCMAWLGTVKTALMWCAAVRRGRARGPVDFVRHVRHP